MQRLGYSPILAALALFMGIACSGERAPATDQVAEIARGDRVTISLALHDGVGQRAALYAIEQAIVTSDAIDVVPTYLTAVELDEAVQSRQYDVVEAPILTVPVSKTEGLDLVILSPGVEDVDGTSVFVAADSDIERPEELRGETLGTVSLGDPAVLAARFLLWQRYQVRADVLENESKQSTVDVAPIESQAALLRDGQLDAVIASQQGAYLLARDPNVRRLINVTAGLRRAQEAPFASSLLVTYPDVVARKGEALAELNRLLAESVAYFKANSEAVSTALVADGSIDPGYLAWWWQHYDLPFGDLSPARQEQILLMWEAARALGDIERYPELRRVVFDPETAGTATPGVPP